MRTYFTALFAVMLALAVPTVMWAQPGSDALDLAVPSDYRIAGITVLGAEFTDVQAVKLFSGLQVGDEVVIPGERLAAAVHPDKLPPDLSDVATEIFRFVQGLRDSVE